MNSIQGAFKTSLPRHKLSKIMYDKVLKEKAVSEELYLVYSSFMAEQGKIRESLNALCLAIKQFSSNLTIHKIIPTVSKIIESFRQESNASNLTFQDPLACPSCRGVLGDPVTIHCGHTHCRKCFVPKAQTGGATAGAVTCSICHTRMTQDQVSHLQADVLVSSLVSKWWKRELQAVTLRAKANKLYKEKHYMKAIELYTQALKLVPGDHLLLSNRSHAFHILGQDEEALKDAEEAVRRRPSWAKGHFRRANALLALRRERDALTCMLICAVLETSSDLDPVLTEIANILLRVLSKDLHSCGEAFPQRSPQVDERRRAFCKVGSATGLTKTSEAFSPLRKRRFSDSGIPMQFTGGETLPQVTKILQDFEAEIDRIKSSLDQLTPYAASVNPSSVQKSDFECSLCYHLLWEPVTTPCGHTFCRSCLDRSLDHASHCPLCKSSLREYLAENRSSINHFVNHAMKTQLPNEYEEREHQHELELSEFAKAGKDLEHKIPIFVATLAIPSISCPLHVFEPRYRLMIRRVMEAGTREFGMCMPSESEENGYSNYGTMLEVLEVKPLPDGRRIVNAVGSRRFRCISKGMKDGYNTASVEFLKDEEVCATDLEDLKHLHSSVHEKAKKWFESVELETKRRILSHYGEMPQVEIEYWTLPDGPVWIWWLITILPLDSNIQMRILKVQNLHFRLTLVSQILRCVLAHQNRSD